MSYIKNWEYNSPEISINYIVNVLSCENIYSVISPLTKYKSYKLN